MIPNPIRVLNITTGAFLLIAVRPARAALLTNGSFESPAVSSGSFLDITAGMQPSGFGWSVTSGGVDVVAVPSIWAATAFDGNQFLDLDGFVPGAITQSFTTTPGIEYVLTFAYANNPLGPGGPPPPGCGGSCATVPATATVSVVNSGTGTQVVSPFLITHGDSTATNPNWTASGAMSFVAEGTTTTLSFVSDDPSSSDGGIFLDGISVTEATPTVPEPSSLVLEGIGFIAVMGLLRRRLSRNRALVVSIAPNRPS